MYINASVHCQVGSEDNDSILEYNKLQGEKQITKLIMPVVPFLFMTQSWVVLRQHEMQ